MPGATAVPMCKEGRRGFGFHGTICMLVGGISGTQSPLVQIQSPRLDKKTARRIDMRRAVSRLCAMSYEQAEDNLLRLDRTLADLFAYVDKKIGLEHTLIVLSADHGGPEAPGFMKSFGIDSGYVSPDEWDKAPSIERLKKEFGIGQKLIKSFFPPYLYLDRKLIQAKGLNLETVERAVAKELMGIKGVALAVSSSALQGNKLPNTFLNRAALRSFNSKRSGDILILFEPHYFINHYSGEVVAANHGGAWVYDSFVPVVFAGGAIKPERIFRRIEPKDIAPTLSAIAGTRYPSGSTGDPLLEVMESTAQWQVAPSVNDAAK